NVVITECSLFCVIFYSLPSDFRLQLSVLLHDNVSVLKFDFTLPGEKLSRFLVEQLPRFKCLREFQYIIHPVNTALVQGLAQNCKHSLQNVNVDVPSFRSTESSSQLQKQERQEVFEFLASLQELRRLELFGLINEKEILLLLRSL